MEGILSYITAFFVGGCLSLIAQVLIDRTKLTPARILVFYVVAGVILTGLGIYGPLVDFAGCGATVPLTGFGYSLAMGVKEAIAERGLVGALTGGLTATSGGIAAAMVSAFLASLIFRGKPKG